MIKIMLKNDGDDNYLKDNCYEHFTNICNMVRSSAFTYINTVNDDIRKEDHA